MDRNTVAADQSRWGTFDQLAEHHRAVLQGILEKAAVDKPNRTRVEQRIGDSYASCMDEQPIEKLGTQPLKAELDRINAIAAKSGILGELVRLHLMGVPALFNFYSAPDAKNSMLMLGQADQGGLGLPDRDYYLKDDAKSVELRKQYVAHVARMLELLGEPSGKAPSHP